MTDHVVFVPGVQQSDSVLHIHVSVLVPSMMSVIDQYRSSGFDSELQETWNQGITEEKCCTILQSWRNRYLNLHQSVTLGAMGFSLHADVRPPLPPLKSRSVFGSFPSSSFFGKNLKRIGINSSLCFTELTSEIIWHRLSFVNKFFNWCKPLTHYWSVHIFYFFMIQSQWVACFWVCIHFF